MSWGNVFGHLNFERTKEKIPRRVWVDPFHCKQRSVLRDETQEVYVKNLDNKTGTQGNTGDESRYFFLLYQEKRSERSILGKDFVNFKLPVHEFDLFPIHRIPLYPYFETRFKVL